MYQFIAKWQIRKAFQHINAGDFDAVVQDFAPDIRFTFAGTHAIGADLNTRDSARKWFDRLHEVFPTLKVTPKRISVAGFPWDMVATTEFDVFDTLPDGQPYHNHGVQIVRIRFGRAIEDHIIEDTLLLNNALNVLRECGKSVADAPPIKDVI